MDDKTPSPSHHLIVSGTAGSGKSTIAAAVAQRCGLVFLEGDAFHPSSNVEKLRSGVPLDDDDRMPWLRAIRAAMDLEAQRGGRVVVACSALKRSYRAVLRDGPGGAWTLQLATDAATLRTRVAARPEHFMPASLVSSQLATLEGLGPDEPGSTVDATGSLAEVSGRVERALEPWCRQHPPDRKQ